MTTTDPMFQVRVDIPRAQAQELSKRANAIGLSRSDILRNLIDAYLGASNE